MVSLPQPHAHEIPNEVSANNTTVFYDLDRSQMNQTNESVDVSALD